jgi:TonB-like protein
MVLETTAYATAHSDGTLSDISVVDLSLTPVFSDAVRSALLRMSSERATPIVRAIPMVPSYQAIPLGIDISLAQHPDTVAQERQLFRVKSPHYRREFKNVAPTKGQSVKYPWSAQLAGVGDSIVLSYTILSDGTVAAQSVRLRGGNYQDFVEPVLSSLAKTTFEPATIGGCRVATWVQQAFVFGIRRR